jgi:HEAT repeat protein
MFLQSFLLGAANNFVQAAAFTLFLVEFNAQSLAYIYIANALVIPLLTFVYLRLGKRVPFAQLLLYNLGFLFFLILGFRFGLEMKSTRWLVFALPILFQILVIFGNLEFWTLAARLFNVRQSKRLFGVIGAGLWLAIVLTGLLIPLLVAWLGTVNLLFLSAAAVAGALGLMHYTTRSYSGKLDIPNQKIPAAKTRNETQSSLQELLKSRYIILIFTLVTVWWVAFTFIDNIFYLQTTTRFPGEEQLASFLGLYLAFLGLLTLISNTFLTGPVIKRFGVRISLLVLPVALVTCTGAMLIGGTILGSVVFLFWIAILTKLVNLSLGFSIDRSAQNILYQPLPAVQRTQTQTMSEGIFIPIANGLAGVFLLFINILFTASLLPLTYTLFLLVGIWLLLAVLIGHEYPRMLMKALSRRRMKDTIVSFSDESSMGVLKRKLESPNPGVVLYCLQMLEENQENNLQAILISTLEHPAAEVRAYALGRIEQHGFISAIPKVSYLVDMETIPEVRAAAIRTLATLGEGESYEKVCAFLDDPDPLLQQATMVGLLRSGGIEAVLEAGQKLLVMANSATPSERSLAAQILGEVCVTNFYQPLIPLLQDEDLEVQRSALVAAGQLHNPKLWPLVLETLDSPKLRSVAITALIEGGESVIPELSIAFEQPENSPEKQSNLVKIACRIGCEQAITWLNSQFAHPNNDIRTQVLSALNRCGFEAQPEEVTQIQIQIKEEAALSAETLAILRDIGDEEPTALLQQALLEGLDLSRDRTLCLLSFIYDHDTINQVRDNLRLSSDENKAYAIEVLDVLLSPEIKRMVTPVLSDLSSNKKLEQLGAIFPHAPKDPMERLREIITNTHNQFSPWMRVCALYTTERRPARGLIDAVEIALTAPEALVRETALWVLYKFEGINARNLYKRLYDDPDPQVARFAGKLELEDQEHIMLSTLEKVITLKEVGIFAEIPDESLARVAPLMEEMWVDSGNSIITKGEMGDCLYIIIEGQVRIHDEERTLNYLESGDVFGEISVLDTEPRTASVSAAEDTQLLRLDQESLYEAIDDHSEVAKGIIKMLSRHLRARIQELNDLRAHLEIPESIK